MVIQLASGVNVCICRCWVAHGEAKTKRCAGAQLSEDSFGQTKPWISSSVCSTVYFFHIVFPLLQPTGRLLTLDLICSNKYTFWTSFRLTNTVFFANSCSDIFLKSWNISNLKPSEQPNQKGRACFEATHVKQSAPVSLEFIAKRLCCSEKCVMWTRTKQHYITFHLADAFIQSDLQLQITGTFSLE